MIHPTAIVHPKAKLDETVDVGPYAVVDGGVELGPNCIVGPHVYLTGVLTAGSDNRFHAGCVIGDAPQDLKYKDEPTRLRIGSNNVFREFATVHRSTKADGETVIGSDCFLMVNCHVGHNCVVGDGVILANGALLAGHVTVGDRAFISGNCLIHQFVRVGTLALMQGGAAISQELPPYIIGVHGGNAMSGLNIVGLRRAGFTPEVRVELKKVYRMLFRSGLNLREAVEMARKEFKSEPAKVLIEFVATSKRGICMDVGERKAQEEEE
jgi:UDP-N-acetylglucosamine acyltransferase